MSRLLVGVSGGPDSMALLRLLHAWREAFHGSSGLEILVGHVHHGIRGAEADQDADFVAQEAGRLGLKLLHERVGAPAEAERRVLSLEDAARQLRYEVFSRWSIAHELDAVAVAHHLDDQAETVILRAARGAGLRGVAGMSFDRPLRAEGGARLIRPLLDWRRSELAAFLAEAGCASRTDSSNEDTRIRRNFVRHEILPRLETSVHPGAVESLARLASHARRASEDLAVLGRRAAREALVSRDDESCVLSAEKLRAWPGSVIHETLEHVLAGLGGPSLTSRISDAVQGWLLTEPLTVESSCDLGHGAGEAQAFRIDLRYGLLRVARILEAGVAPPRELELVVPGSVDWGEWTIRVAEATPGETPKLEEGAIRERVDAALVPSRGGLLVRARRPGDRVQPLGAPGSKKLKELFREARVRPEDRARVPVVTAGDEIIWVVGHRIADPFRLTERTGRVLVLDAIHRAGGVGAPALTLEQPAPPTALEGEKA